MNRFLPSCISKSNRGEETRDKLLRAGLVLFGKYGFEGVSARELAAAAHTPLSAMTYHFGTMEALYTAVIAKMVADMNLKMNPAMPSIRADLNSGAITPQQALDQFTEHLVREIVCCADQPEWTMLMMREHLAPSPAFELIYHNVMLRKHELLCDILAALHGMPARSEIIELAAFTYMGKIIFFKTGAQTIRRRMGWTTIGTEQLDSIVKAVKA